MTDQTPHHEKVALARDTFLALYLEQSVLARHHETQRSVATSIFTSLATAVIGLIAALWGVRGRLDVTLVPLTASLLPLAVLGFLITMKMFERSVLHFKLSEAYLNTIDLLMERTVNELVGPEDLNRLAYVAESNGKEGAIRLGRELQSIRIHMEGHDPVNPRPIVVPRHNETAEYLGINFAKRDLFLLWGWVYGLMLGAGILLTAGALWGG